MKKLLTASMVALSFAGTVSADPIFIDTGVDFSAGTTTGAMGSTTTTGWFDSLGFAYSSESTLTDADGDGTLTVGDTIVSNAGMSIGTTVDDILNTNADSLQLLGFDDKNGFWDANGTPTAGQWGITFGFDKMVGVLTNTGFQYTSGTINLFAFDAKAIVDAHSIGGLSADISSALMPLFNLNIASGGDTGNSTVFTGNVINFNPAATTNFNIGYGTASKTFKQASILPGGLQFTTSNDTQGFFPTSFNGNSSLVVSGQHDGSVTFNVPEPASIAILGLSLLGFAGARRRKS